MSVMESTTELDNRGIMVESDKRWFNNLFVGGSGQGERNRGFRGLT
jgi:hypothetical protein